MRALIYPSPSIVLVGGVPGSGKSTLLSKAWYSNSAFLFSADDIRGRVQEAHGFNAHDWIPSCIPEARKQFFSELEENVARGRNLIVEAAYLSSKSQKEMIKWAKDNNYACHLLLVQATLEECLYGVEDRERTVPTDVVLHYWSQWQQLSTRLNVWGEMPKGLSSALIINRYDQIDSILFGKK